MWRNRKSWGKERRGIGPESKPTRETKGKEISPYIQISGQAKDARKPGGEGPMG